MGQPWPGDAAHGSVSGTNDMKAYSSRDPRTNRPGRKHTGTHTMGRRHETPCHMFLGFLVFSSTGLGVFSKNHWSKGISGGCVLEKNLVHALRCSPPIQQSSIYAGYILEHAQCIHIYENRCYNCRNNSLTKSACDDKPHSRKKRDDIWELLRMVLNEIKDDSHGLFSFLSQILGYCDHLPSPSNGKSVTCSNGHERDSVCFPECSSGYKPARGAKAVCNKNKKWTRTSWGCEDVQKPVFMDCPTKKIDTLDKRFRWKVRATDNSGRVTLKQVQGHPPGSLMEFGVHVIRYVATDAAGNSASCLFAVELKKSDCPKPESGDSDMKFTCNGLTSQSVCHLSCTSGSFVQGSKYIACVHDTSQNNTSYWQPIDGEKATCYKRTCPTLSPPKNGALACDKQLGGTVCQIQCDDRFDVAPGEGTRPTFFCGERSGIWTPSSLVPDCYEMAYPDEYSLPTEFFYFVGDCSDAQALDDIKQQFIDNLNSIGLSPCMSDECSVEDIVVTCGDLENTENTDFRTKRSAMRFLRVRLTFHLTNGKRTLSPDAALSMLRNLANKSKYTMSRRLTQRFSNPIGLTKSAARSYSSKSVPQIARQIQGVSLAKSVTGSLTTKCATGYVQLKSKSHTCVPCSAGTYADEGGNICNPCPVNTYQDKPGSTSCTPCPLQHKTSSTGAAIRAACQELCGRDTFSPTGVVPCFPCPEGTYQPGVGSKSCVPCPHQYGIPRCHKKTNLSFSSSMFQISSFLLSCENTTCLSF